MADADSRGRLQGLWKGLRSDAQFRATFVFAVVVPVALAVGVVVWIVRAVLLTPP